MLVKHLFLAVMPTLAFSAISIRVQAGKDNSHVELRGYDENAISDTERKSFKIQGDNLKRIAEEYYESPCNQVYLRPPTNAGDVYELHDWSIVVRRLTPKRAIILGVDTKPVIINSVEYVNFSDQNATYSTAITQTVEESISRAISEGKELSIGQDINYEVNLGAGSVGGTSSLSFSSNWNEETTETRTTTVGTSSSVTVTVPPDSKLEALLTATQGTMKIEIHYVAELDGMVYCWNEDGDNFAIDITRLLVEAKLSSSFSYTETLEVGFYAHVRVELKKVKDDKSA